MPIDEVQAQTEEPTTETADQPTPSVTAPLVRPDANDFDGSDVCIQILLHRADEHPQGRLVSILIHNFEGQPVIGTFREAELTEKSRLDSIHKAIYPLIQRFLLDLSGRKHKKLEEDARNLAKPIPPLTVVPTTKASELHPSETRPTAATETPSPAATESSTPLAQTHKEGNKKKSKQESKYQTIPMF